jgi:hypothetical protein
MNMSEQHDTEIEQEERAIYAIIALAACPVVIGLMIEGGVIDGGGTLSILLVVVGIVGILTTFGLLRRSKIARARIHTRS